MPTTMTDTYRSTPLTIMNPPSHTMILIHATTSRYEEKTFEMTEAIYTTDVANLSSTQAINSATFGSQCLLNQLHRNPITHHHDRHLPTP